MVITVAKDFCQQKFSNRNKEKNKLESKSSTSLTDATKASAANPSAANPSSSAAETASSSVNRPTTSPIIVLPTVRGSFQTFDCEKARNTPATTASTGDTATTAVDTLAKESTITATKLSNVPEKSWLHKAKEGTSMLADMFRKPTS